MLVSPTPIVPAVVVLFEVLLSFDEPECEEDPQLFSELPLPAEPELLSALPLVAGSELLPALPFPAGSKLLPDLPLPEKLELLFDEPELFPELLPEEPESLPEEPELSSQHRKNHVARDRNIKSGMSFILYNEHSQVRSELDF